MSSGLRRDCQLKTLAKFDIARAQEALCWVEEVTGQQLYPAPQHVKSQVDVKDALKDGLALCQLINCLYPGAVKKINTSKLAFKQMENIEMFLKACREYGMKEVDVFQTQDLYENKSMYSVINSLYTLGSLAKKNGYNGPTIGVKIAEENRRTFTEAQITEGKKLISLQYGSNKVASQAGMTPYGATRKM